MNGTRICLIKKIISFGDSFIYGSELTDNTNGSKTWPGIIAQELDCNFQTCAVPGCSNDHIARQIYSYFSNNSQEVLAVINWTWIERVELYCEKWITLGPSCVPRTLSWLNDESKANEILNFYKNFGRSIIWNNFRNLQTIASVQHYLEQKGIVSIQTYMDYELFDLTQPSLNPDYLQELKKLVEPKLSLFDQNLNFLDWAKINNFTVTDPGWHPLEDAHQAAANLWQTRFKEKLQ